MRALCAPRGACVLTLLLASLALPCNADSEPSSRSVPSSEPLLPAQLASDGSVNVAASTALPTPDVIPDAEVLWERAETLRAAGRGAEALAAYRQASTAPGALSARAAALATLARMHDFGWDGVSDLTVFAPSASPPGEAAMLRSAARFLSRLMPRALTHTLSATGVLPSVTAAAASVGYGADLLVPPDMSVAVQLYNASAALGNASAQMTMATLHATGLFGVPHDEARALLFEFFAATGGDVDATLALGVRHATGIATPSSCPAAVTYFETVAHSVVLSLHAAHDMIAGGGGIKSAVALDEDALDDVAVKPSGGSSDSNLLALYHHAADKGEMSAHVLLGHLYFLGAHGVSRDYALASEHFHAAAENEDEMSIANLGIMYYYGLGVVRDDALAHGFVVKGVQKGAAAAVNLMGVWHTTGLSNLVQVDKRAAFEFFQRAAALQFMDAHYNLALMHLHGTAPAGRDFRAAYAHLAAAAQSGHIKALYRVGLMHLHGIGTGVDCGAAQRAFRNAVQRMNISPALDNAYNLVAVGNVPAAVLQYVRAAEVGQDIGYSNAAALIELGLLSPAVADPVGSNASSPLPPPRQYTHGGGLLFSIASQLLPRPGARTTPALQRLVLRMRSRSTVYLNGAAELALGDAAFYGHGGLNVSFPLAAERYQAACNLRIPQACWNMGYMHEYGLGVTRDGHLAKRFYDLCLEHQKGRQEPAPVPVQLALGRMAAARGWDWFFVTYGRRWAHASGFPEFGAWLHAYGQWALSAAPHTHMAPGHSATPAPTTAAASEAPSASAAPAASTDASASDTVTASASPAASVVPTPTPQPEELIAAALQRAKAARVQRQQAESISNAALGLMHEALRLVMSLWAAFSLASHTLVTALASVTSGGRAATRFSKEDSTILVLCIVLGAVLFLRVNFRRRHAPDAPPAAPQVQQPQAAAAAA